MTNKPAKLKDLITAKNVAPAVEENIAPENPKHAEGETCSNLAVECKCNNNTRRVLLKIILMLVLMFFRYLMYVWLGIKNE